MFFKNVFETVLKKVNLLLIKDVDILEEIIKGIILDNIESRKEIKESIESASKYFKFTKLENEIRNTKK